MINADNSVSDTYYCQATIFKLWFMHVLYLMSLDNKLIKQSAQKKIIEPEQLQSTSARFKMDQLMYCGLKCGVRSQVNSVWFSIFLLLPCSILYNVFSYLTFLRSLTERQLTSTKFISDNAQALLYQMSNIDVHGYKQGSSTTNVPNLVHCMHFALQKYFT